MAVYLLGIPEMIKMYILFKFIFGQFHLHTSEKGFSLTSVVNITSKIPHHVIHSTLLFYHFNSYGTHDNSSLTINIPFNYLPFSSRFVGKLCWGWLTFTRNTRVLLMLKILCWNPLLGSETKYCMHSTSLT